MRADALRVRLVAALVALAGAVAPRCAAQAPFTQTGIASYYDRDFHGRTTANGETYSMWSMTAAHRTIPFNALVRVTNLDNGKSVVVRINDAGPFRDDRIIDLSRAAAAKLGMLRTGTARVRLEVVGTREGSTAVAGAGSPYYRVDLERSALKGFAVQVGSFRDFDHLVGALQRFASLGVAPVYVQTARVSGAVVNRIVVGGFVTRDAAERYAAGLRVKNVTGFVYQVR